ncbi:MAG: serine/threonine-protein phosphatase 6 regulatory ankyrin repeat subunit A-like [Chlamydiales bacterium]|jgi:ankyrin repeat protein|nr:serine/threonine-protein phosphatase 6 regulatory ankyrin repeat subunit A-like [Chlamydiales bacterium]
MNVNTTFPIWQTIENISLEELDQKLHDKNCEYKLKNIVTKFLNLNLRFFQQKHSILKVIRCLREKDLKIRCVTELLNKVAEENLFPAEEDLANPVAKEFYLSHLLAIKQLLDSKKYKVALELIKLLPKQIEISFTTDLEQVIYQVCQIEDLYVVLLAVELLYKKGVNFNISFENGHTPLHIACKRGFKNLVELLVQNDCKIDIQDQNGHSPLHIAIIERHVEVALYLIDRMALMNIPDLTGSTPLHYACEKGEIALINKMLREGANIELEDNDHDTPLARAYKNDHHQLTVQLIKRLAEESNNGENPIHIIGKYNLPFLLYHFIDEEYDLNKQNEQLQQPLHYACARAHSEAVLAFLENGAQVDVPDRDGNTPLHLACKHGHSQICLYLIEKGAKINFLNSDNLSPLHLACRHQDLAFLLFEKNVQDENQRTILQAAYEIGDKNLITELHQREANLHICDQKGYTLLHIVCEKNHIDLVVELYQKGLSLEAQNMNGQTPLHLACIHKHYALVQKLLELGALAETQNNFQERPLHIASQLEDPLFLQLLLDKKANLNARNGKGETCLHIACKAGYAAIAKILLEKGIDILARDHKHNTALHSAYFEKKCEVIPTLLQYLIPNIQDVQDLVLLALKLSLKHQMPDHVLALIEEIYNGYQQDQNRFNSIKVTEVANTIIRKSQEISSIIKEYEDASLLRISLAKTNEDKQLPLLPKVATKLNLNFLLILFDRIDENGAIFTNDNEPITREELRQGLEHLIECVKIKNPKHYGVPKDYKPFYQKLETLLRHISHIFLQKLAAAKLPYFLHLDEFSKEDFSTQLTTDEIIYLQDLLQKIVELPLSTNLTIDFTFFDTLSPAQQLIYFLALGNSDCSAYILQLAEAGKHCGGRWITESLQLYTHLTEQNHPDYTLEQKIHASIDSYKSEIIMQMASEGDNENSAHEIQFYTKTLHSLGIAIPHAETMIYEDPYEYHGTKGRYQIAAQVIERFDRSFNIENIYKIAQEIGNAELKKLSENIEQKNSVIEALEEFCKNFYVCDDLQDKEVELKSQKKNHYILNLERLLHSHSEQETRVKDRIDKERNSELKQLLYQRLEGLKEEKAIIPRRAVQETNEWFWREKERLYENYLYYTDQKLIEIDEIKHVRTLTPTGVKALLLQFGFIQKR